MRAFLRARPASSSCTAFACRRNAFSTSSLRARKKSRQSNAPKTFSSAGFERITSDLASRLQGSADTTGTSKERHRTEATKAYGVFRQLSLNKYDQLMSGSRGWDARKEDYMAFGVETQFDFNREVKLFRNLIEKACDLASEHHAISKNENPLFAKLRGAFVEEDIYGLIAELTYGFQTFLMRSRFPKNIADTQREIADSRYPWEWFPATRALQRTIHIHVGPTNSGKTYNALKALEAARSGIYAGPLRLLAHEVYTRFTAKGKKCALITGEEQRIPEDEDNFFRSCTVEMTPLNLPVDVAVIDEIQMIGDSERGWAWTQAFLGVQAKEVHLCGETRAVDLIKSLCATIGDKCIVHEYERLSPLQTMDRSLNGDLRNLQKGDAVITFSRVGIHALKKEIEKETGRRCAMVYGSLPPETRAQQAAYFNDPKSGYDFLVASDAIGMGLNLEIRRVVFEQTHKRTRTGYRIMTTSELKQIGGRAGRYKTARQDIESRAGSGSDNKKGTVESKSRPPGLVTALEDADLGILQRAFDREAEPLKTAGIQPPPSMIERFHSYFPPNTPFSYVVSRLRDLAQMSPRFHMCFLGEVLAVADLIQPYPMSVYDRCVFLNAPVSLRERNGAQVLQAFARCVSNMGGGDLLDIPEISLEVLDLSAEDLDITKAEHLRELEALHKTITLYLWLTYRYSGVFRSQSLAFHVKELVEDRINTQLLHLNLTGAKRKARTDAIRAQALQSERKLKRVLGEEDKVDPPQHELSGAWNEEGHEEPLYDPSELEPAPQSPPVLKGAQGRRHHKGHSHIHERRHRQDTDTAVQI
ncbi:P-loop containing nucleoside triphosphate hydrolase protein [Durotheca rogersii]|uniref:P-loop containing nucleoside triphosphate hydrolase protein n=1 Tax=Durotheca rogersii TaxID=419775 RepID=UPI00221EBA48|nr:P-loop containing nucleoside triphosphate hydrolase protein [Durotheca rogersii]KAI5868456.1 P-loop containing nucleoside triphosphate hydrolase protein [Durotheca rogersii]